MATTVDTDITNGDAIPVVPLWIGGEETTSTPPVTFPFYSSAQRKTVSLVHAADVPAAIRACDAADIAFHTWGNSRPADRREIMLRAVDILEARRPEMVALQVAETSCPEGWAHFNLDNLIGIMRESASRITTVCVGTLPSLAGEGTLALVFKRPVGPVLLIAPWNASVILGGRGLLSILAAGCSVVMKASELSPRTHHRLAQIFIEAGVPPAAVNVIQTRREDAPAVTEALIAHKAIKKVEFVGSAAVGSIVGSLAGKYLKPVLMELGGKCSAIVLDDADLDDAAGKCIAGGSLTFYSLRPSSPIITPGSRAFLLFTNAQTAFMHHGQICFSTERIIVLESVADEFIELLKQKAAEYISSNAATVNLAQKAHGYLVDAERKGAKYIFGKAEFLSDISLAPALLTGVTKEMSIWDEETFGPSASVFVVDNDNEAVVLANDSVYGLNAAVHTGNMQRALNVGNRLEVGQVHVNALTENDEPTFPLGATKGSGWGRTNASYGIEEFLATKLISFNMERAKLAFELANT